MYCDGFLVTGVFLLSPSLLSPLYCPPPQGYHVHLGEAALELWGEVLHHATTMTPDLMTLFRNMGGALGVGLPAGDSGRSIAGLLGTHPLPLGTRPPLLGTRPLPLLLQFSVCLLVQIWRWSASKERLKL